MNPRVALLSLVPLALGCSAELGAHVGAALPVHDPSVPRQPPRPETDVHWAGHLATSTAIGSRQHGFLIGYELEGRAERTLGARLTSGFQLGYARHPVRELWAFGWETHLDFGTPLRQAALFPRGDFYAGGTFAGVLWLTPRRDLADVNNSTWFMTRVPELVFYLRNRYHFDHTSLGEQLLGAPDRRIRSDIGAGIALRVQVVSDLF